MKPAIDTNKHGDPGSSSSQPSQAGHGLARLRKELKRERRRERENVRFIDGWEQYKTLWDGIEFKRQLINMGDKKVRFALAIMAALNAVMLVVLTIERSVDHINDLRRGPNDACLDITFFAPLAAVAGGRLCPTRDANLAGDRQRPGGAHGGRSGLDDGVSDELKPCRY